MLKPFDLQALSIFLCIKVALVTDICCGTGAFLIAALARMKKNISGLKISEGAKAAKYEVAQKSSLIGVEKIRLCTP